MEQDLPPAPARKEAYKLSNLCSMSKVRDNEEIEYTRAAGSPLAAVIDGDPSTYLTKACTRDQWLDIRFPGARAPKAADFPHWRSRARLESLGVHSSNGSRRGHQEV
jgi:hypothetical protein